MEQIVESLEKQCRRLSRPILNRIGWRVIRRIGKEMERAPIQIDDDMAGLGLSFFDQLSIYYQILHAYRLTAACLNSKWLQNFLCFLW